MENGEIVNIELTQEEYDIIYDTLRSETKRTMTDLIYSKGDLDKEIFNRRLDKLNKLTNKFTE